MKLFYKLSDDCNPNYIVKYIDNSFGSNGVYFDFQVSLTPNRSFILNFDVYSKKCVSCEGYLLIDKKIKNDNIVIFPNGNFLTNKIYYNSSKSEYKALTTDEIIPEDYIDECKKYTDDRLKISNDIIVYDLIKSSGERLKEVCEK
jgi:hypothetical protein